jgi:hypothetical protein
VSGWLFGAEERQVSGGVKVRQQQKWNSRVLPAAQMIGTLLG